MVPRRRSRRGVEKSRGSHQTGRENLFDVQLIVDDVEEEDAGLYKVKARNKYGEVAASINLNFSREYYLFLTRSLVGRFRARIFRRRTVRRKKMLVSVRLGQIRLC